MTVKIQFVAEGKGRGKTILSGVLASLFGSLGVTCTHEDDLETFIEVEDPVNAAQTIARVFDDMLKNSTETYPLIGRLGDAKGPLEAAATAYLAENEPGVKTRVAHVSALLRLAGCHKITEIKPQDRDAAMVLIRALGSLDETDSNPIPGGVPGYEPLAEVLREAYDQSAKGKGKERHGNGLPFLMQPIMAIARMSGLGGHIYQMMKKAQEAGGMALRGNTSGAKAEMLGVIVYAAAAYKLIEEQEMNR